MVFLDFDGVLVDSNNETFKNFFYSIESTFNKPLKKKEQKIINEKMLLIRGKIGPIKDFFLEYKKILQEDILFKDFDLKTIDKNLDLLVKNFLSNRSQSKTEDLRAWEKLHKPSGIIETIKRIPKKFIIVSTKDEDSLLDLSQSLQLEPLTIYGKEAFEFYGSKKNIILKIIKEKNYLESIFIDDNEEHLFRSRKVHSFFANWGYGYCKNFEQISELEASKIILDH